MVWPTLAVHNPGGEIMTQSFIESDTKTHGGVGVFALPNALRKGTRDACEPPSRLPPLAELVSTPPTQVTGQSNNALFTEGLPLIGPWTSDPDMRVDAHAPTPGASSPRTARWAKGKPGDASRCGIATVNAPPCHPSHHLSPEVMGGPT